MMLLQSLVKSHFEQIIFFTKREISGYVIFHYFEENVIFAKFRKTPVFMKM